MAAPTTTNGVWFGRATLAGDQIAVRVDLRETSGALRGVVYLGDATVGELLDAGALTGTRNAAAATFSTGPKLVVNGNFDGDSFTGTLSITRPNGQKVDAGLTLARAATPRKGYVPIAPTRLIDTRDDYAGYPPSAGEIVSVPVTGKGGIPFNGVSAVVVNITGTDAVDRGYVTAFASGEKQPFTSNVYLERTGQTAGNLAIVPVGRDGYISIFTQSGTHLVVDAFGWFPTDSVLQRVEPQRAFDTRAESAIGYTGPKPGPATTVTASIAGIAGIPASGVSAVVVNITATESSAAGYITAWASGLPRPLAANLNLTAAGQTIGNLAIVPVNATSAIDLFTQSGTHLIVDVLGWFPQPDSGPIGNPPAAGTIARDGSFEPSPTIPVIPSFQTIGDNATIGSWMVIEGGVDLVGPTSATAFDGDQFVDLNGNGRLPGVIQQMVPTTNGRRYAVSFRLAGNPNGGPTVKTVEVAFGDQLKTYTFDVTGHTNNALGWVENRFVANPDCGSATALTFRSRTTGERGPNIDAISVVDDGPADSCHRGGYRAVGPARLLDTRPISPVGYSGPKPGVAGEVKVQIAGKEGMPATGITAVVINLTATESDEAGFVTAWASGAPRPFTSSLNLDAAGQTRPNHAIVPVGADGAISLYTLRGTHLIVDVFGYFS